MIERYSSESATTGFPLIIVCEWIIINYATKAAPSLELERECVQITGKIFMNNMLTLTEGPS